ncbi:ARM repeat superfamily protein [Actinidia rufa]|uniref:ARM repeat superfamily protein n=1 Tax=Actinidia rufa TaxID=165716 RepID=A0A7J0FH41_9ERIC|nr:ARM repeat superfamily protein [Actinidia rufa]
MKMACLIWMTKDVEKQQCAVAASNIVRNFCFMPENEVIMAQHHHLLETVFQCIEDHITDGVWGNQVKTSIDVFKSQLVFSDVFLDTTCSQPGRKSVNPGKLPPTPVLTLNAKGLGTHFESELGSKSKQSKFACSCKFSSTSGSSNLLFIKAIVHQNNGERAVQAIVGMLGSSVRAWHFAAVELLGRLIINLDNEPFILPFGPQIYKHLVHLLSFPAVDSQAAAVGALYNLAEVNMDCRLKLACERW